MTKEDVLDFFFKTVEDVIGCVTLPTGDSLIPTFIYSLVITVASAISEFAFHWSFFDFRGALIATVLLLGLAIIERKGVGSSVGSGRPIFTPVQRRGPLFLLKWEVNT